MGDEPVNLCLRINFSPLYQKSRVQHTVERRVTTFDVQKDSPRTYAKIDRMGWLFRVGLGSTRELASPVCICQLSFCAWISCTLCTDVLLLPSFDVHTVSMTSDSDLVVTDCVHKDGLCCCFGFMFGST